MSSNWFATYLLAVASCLLSLNPCFSQSTNNETNENWSAFRGANGTGQALGAKLPTDFSNPENLDWKTPIHGKGWSSPVVWKDQIWLTTATPDGTKMSALCIELSTGKVLQDLVIHENEKPDFCHSTNSYASPTPVIEDGRVYLHFGKYGTTCLNSVTGEKIWQRKDFECDHFRGPASSPIVYGDHLFVAFDGFDQQYVVALNKETGKTVWKKDREIEYGTDNGDLKKAYSTASVFEIDGSPLLIYPSAIATVAYLPATGEVAWTAYHGGMNASARPIQTNKGLVILSNGMGKMVAVDPKGSGNITDTNVAWSFSKSVIRKPSPLVIGDRLYMISDKGVASSIDTDNGEIVWQERLGGKFAASPVFDGENIFAFDEGGTVFVFKPSEKFELVNKFKLGDGFRGSPAIVGNRVILRSLTHLYSVSKK